MTIQLTLLQDVSPIVGKAMKHDTPCSLAQIHFQSQVSAGLAVWQRHSNVFVSWETFATSGLVLAFHAQLLLTPLALSTHGFSLKTSRFPPPSITARKIGPISSRMALLSAVSSSLKVAYSHLSNFIKKVRLAFNYESQQGGKAGFTVIGANLPCNCLQCLTGDQEQTKAGTGGEKLQEALVNQLAHKAIGFLGGSKPHLPSSMLFSLFKALRDAQVTSLLADRDSPFDILQYLCDFALPISCLPTTGKLKGWCQLQGSPYTSSSHTLFDVLPTLTSRRWLCTTLIYNTPLDKPWPLVTMKTSPGTTGDQTPCGHPKCILPREMTMNCAGMTFPCHLK